MHLVTLLSADNVRLYSCALLSPRNDPLEPPEVGRPVLVCAGMLRISATEGREIAYLKIGSFSHPLMMRTRIWRVKDKLIFGQPMPGRFWTLEIPFGRIDVILSQVCNLRPKLDVSEPIEEEADTSDRGPSAAVLDAMETCKKRPQSVTSVYSDDHPIPQRSTSLNKVGPLEHREFQKPPENTHDAQGSRTPVYDPNDEVIYDNRVLDPPPLSTDTVRPLVDDETRFDDPEDEVEPEVSHQQNVSKYSFLDSDDSDEGPVREGLGINIGRAEPSIEQSPTHAKALLSRSASVSSTNQPSLTSSPQVGLEQAFTPVRGSSLAPLTPSKVHDEPKSPSPVIERPVTIATEQIAYKNEVCRTLEAILVGTRHRSSPSEESFGPLSPTGLAKNPVFIATPTQTFAEFEAPDDLFAPDQLSVGDFEIHETHLFKHPLIPASIYPSDSQRPALRTKDLIKIGTHASNSEIGTVGAYISWQMINRIAAPSRASLEKTTSSQPGVQPTAAAAVPDAQTIDNSPAPASIAEQVSGRGSSLSGISSASRVSSRSFNNESLVNSSRGE